MTIDKREIKSLALACDPAKCADEAEEGRRLAEFYSEMTPETILALLAEIERLEVDNGSMRGSTKRMGEDASKAQKQARKAQREIDQLKAENEALRKIISESSAACGAAVSVECSLEFMAMLPAEIGSVLTALRKDAERYRFVRNPIGTSSPLAIWNEGKMPLFSSIADSVVDEFMAKEASHA